MAYQQEFSAVSNIISNTEGRTDLTPQEKQKALQQVLQQHPGQASQLLPAIAMLQKSIQPQTQAMARGGIVAFKQGGKVKKAEQIEGYREQGTPYVPAEPKKLPTPEIKSAEIESPDISDIMADRPATPIRGYARGSQVEWKLPDQMQSDYAARQAAKAAAWAEENKNQRTGRPLGTNPYMPVDRNTPTAGTARPPVTYQVPKDLVPTLADQQAAHYVPPKVEFDPHYFDGLDTAGIGSLSGRGSGSFSLPRFDVKDPDVHDRQYYMKQQQDFMGNNADLTDARAQLEETKAGQAKESANNVNMAMIRAGLGMMASKRPDFLGGAGEGGISGLEQYSVGQQQAAKAQSEDLARRLQIGSIERQERANMYQQGSADERADKHAKTEMDVARLRHDADNARTLMSVNAMNKPAAIMDAKATSFAHDYYKDDIKNNVTPQLPGDYYSRGLSKANPTSYATDARSDTAARGQYEKAKTAFNNTHPPTAYFPTFEVWNQSGGFVPTTVRD